MSFNKVLVIAEIAYQQSESYLNVSTLNAISAACEIAGKEGIVDVLVAGHNALTIANQLSTVKGISAIKLVESEYLKDNLAENLASQIEPIVKDNAYNVVVCASTSHGKNVAPRISALLDVAQVSDVLSIVSNQTPLTFTRPMYAGNVIATLACHDKTVVLTVRTTAFNPAIIDADCSPVKIEHIQFNHDIYKPLSSVVSRESVKTDRPELTSAKIVVSGGRALGSQEHFSSVMLPLADKLNAAVGASRAAVDAGYAPNDWQIGQTGKIVAPQLYIAVGMSGAIQHLAGMKDSKIIVAINKDPDAPIFQIADYGLVADLFDAVPELTSKL